MKINLVCYKKVLTVTLTIALSILSCNSYAEYYLAYSSPECASCYAQRQHVTRYYHHHHVKHAPVTQYCQKRPHHRHHYVSHRRSHYSISVYYYHYNMYPPCGYQGGCETVRCGCETVRCATCSPCQSSYQQRSRMYVGFSGEPTSYRGTRLYTNEETEPSYYQDRATSDDDANAYPDMNINN